MENGFPIAYSAEWPKVASAPWFQSSKERLRFRGRAALGHVLFDGDIADDFAVRVPNGSDPHLLGVEGSVFPPIDHLAVPDSPGRDGIPELLVELRAVTSRFEEARVLSDRFLAAVSGHRRERGIHILNLPGGIGDDDGIGRLLDGCDQPGPLDIRLPAITAINLIDTGSMNLPMQPLTSEAGTSSPYRQAIGMRLARISHSCVPCRD
jgi:hypothetical protein